jgi:hypothetical protein
VILFGLVVAASGDESLMSNSSSSSDTSSSSSRAASLLSPSGYSWTDFGEIALKRPRVPSCLLDFLGLAGSSSTKTNDFCRSRSFHFRVRDMAWNQSVDWLSAQTVGNGYLDAVTFI